MPRRDGTGSMWSETNIGRGFGPCTVDNAADVKDGVGVGFGYACRHGFEIGRGYGRCAAEKAVFPITQKELLQEQKSVLQSRIHTIDMQIERL